MVDLEIQDMVAEEDMAGVEAEVEGLEDAAGDSGVDGNGCETPGVLRAYFTRRSGFVKTVSTICTKRTRPINSCNFETFHAVPTYLCKQNLILKLATPQLIFWPSSRSTAPSPDPVMCPI
jgi:hypothetical protein